MIIMIYLFNKYILVDNKQNKYCIEFDSLFIFEMNFEYIFFIIYK